MWLTSANCARMCWAGVVNACLWVACRSVLIASRRTFWMLWVRNVSRAFLCLRGAFIVWMRRSVCRVPMGILRIQLQTCAGRVLNSLAACCAPTKTRANTAAFHTTSTKQAQNVSNAQTQLLFAWHVFKPHVVSVARADTLWQRSSHANKWQSSERIRLRGWNWLRSLWIMIRWRIRCWCRMISLATLGMTWQGRVRCSWLTTIRYRLQKRSRRWSCR